MKRVIICILLASLLLSGCTGWLNASYHSVTRYEDDGSQEDAQIVSVSSFSGMCQTLCELVASGTQSAIISVSRYDQEKVASDMERAIENVMATDPVAAYAVENIVFELGANAGQPAVALTIGYIHDRTEILKISRLETMEEAKAAMAAALDACNSGAVLYVSRFEQMDFTQWVSDYAAANPDTVMELPEVTANLYPEEGEARVVELKFNYQNSRESLRAMQSKIGSLFDAAVIYAGDDDDVQEQYYKLYSFLMGLFQEIQVETSITPAYSLLQHGVGDSKAFATVYAAMCAKTGLECVTVTGTKNSEPWYWNIITCDGAYYHVDLLQIRLTDEFEMKIDADMSGYVWDYSAYPACVAPEAEPETEPKETQAEE